jgi:hypothetical protein
VVSIFWNSNVAIAVSYLIVVHLPWALTQQHLKLPSSLIDLTN